MAAQAGEFLPGLAAVDRAEQGGVFHPGVDGIRIGQRRFEMPDSLELPGVRRAVVPLVSAGVAVVHELVADRLPRLAAVVGALNHLPEPAAGLRRIQPVRVDGRALQVVDLPARKVGAADVPPLALAVRRQDERALRVPTSTRTALIAYSFPRSVRVLHQGHVGFLPGFERQRQRRHVISDGDGNGRRGMKVTAQEFLLLAHQTRLVSQSSLNQ